MSAPLHLNLLNEQERFSSSPVRSRVMIPMFVILATAGLGVWWSLFSFRLHDANQQKAAVETRVSELTPAFEHVKDLRARETESTAVLQQLGFYRAARLLFGDALQRVPAVVPAAVQLTEMRIKPPSPPPPAPVSKTNPKSAGPTNLSETVTLLLTGRAGGDRPSEAIRALLESLRSPAFTNLIRTAEIPKGAFRQEASKNSAAPNTLLFEITCDCSERRFE